MFSDSELENLFYDDDGIPVLKPEQLALVHVTRYHPLTKEGHWEIQSTAEATDYIYPRNTIHFTDISCS